MNSFPDGVKLFIFDMDGTIFLGNRVFPEAVRFINSIRSKGKKVIFFTNNASADKRFYYEKLGKMGFCPRDGEIMTSADVTIAFFIREKADKTFFVLGTPLLTSQFTDAGFRLSDDADVVVLSFDKTLVYEKLVTACHLLNCGAEYYATHLDINCPTEDGPIPDSGAIAALIKASTGRYPVSFGKPSPDTLGMICRMTGYVPSEICFVGDRLYTDIAVSKSIEGDPAYSVLVLTGETTEEMALAAEGAQKPDMIVSDLSELYGIMKTK